MFARFDTTWVFPNALCVEKLRNTLAQTLRDYPHVAGRLYCNQKTQELRIKLTNDSVPITVGFTNLPYATDKWFYNNENHPDIVDWLPMLFDPSGVDNKPLVRFKLTTWKKTGETSLSVAWGHVLGSTLMGLMLSISNYYQDLRPVMIPTFEKYLDPVPRIEQQYVYDTLAQVPHLGLHYSKERVHEMYNEMQSTTSRMDIKLDPADIMAIRDMARKSTEMSISAMDSLAAYLVTVLNKTEDVPIWRIYNVIEYRGAKSDPRSIYIPPPMTSAGNNTVTVHAKPMSTDRNASIGSIAEVIREQIIRTREPENLRRIVGLSDELFNKTTEAGHSFWWFPYEGAVGINNTFKISVHDQHFGYPDRTHFCELMLFGSVIFDPNYFFSV
ncbi:hypothetical protein PILCRDRAFT_5880 [Piloderma croceum F 1598]|uniref:Uncharacterized protein n=1 Tax=Piloderma croceum (strain F 1598) TaxID=765440 RepID=A0A0C3G2I8_PILCF|nr:hypothetical protein PILCRDRAFT_5880 [Piloderma croceum F 1598]